MTSSFFPPRAVSLLGESLATSSYACRLSRAPDPLCAPSAGETVRRAPSEARSSGRPTCATGNVSRGHRPRGGYAFSSAPSGTMPVLAIAPERDDHPPRQGDNADAARHRTAAAEPRVIPVGERARRLIPEPGPRDLDRDPADGRQAAPHQPLIPRLATGTAPRRAGEGAHLAAVAQVAPKQFVDQHRRAPRRDPPQLHQPLHRGRRGRGARLLPLAAAGALRSASITSSSRHVASRAPAPRRQRRARPIARRASARATGHRSAARHAVHRQQTGIRFRHRVRSACNVVNPRLACRASSASRVGTCTTCHRSRSPPQYRTSIRSNLAPSSRSVFARRARRGTSMLDESTTRFVTPSRVSSRCGQNPSRPAS